MYLVLLTLLFYIYSVNKLNLYELSFWCIQHLIVYSSHGIYFG